MTDFEKKIIALMYQSNKQLLQEIKKLNTSVNSLNESIKTFNKPIIKEASNLPKSSLVSQFQRNAGLTENPNTNSNETSGIYNFLKENVVSEGFNSDDLDDEEINTASILDHASPDNLIGKMLNKDFRKIVKEF